MDVFFETRLDSIVIKVIFITLIRQKGWETRRKAENERLKREIAQMVVLLRESLVSKDEAINNLYVVAERMDRIQSLVDSVEDETISNTVGLIQKFRRIWLAIKEILSE
ncbi:hypothetical protein NIES4106_50350 [Fischerella sp. NIES-4106]|jgi:hypothetical protein|nr:hypothetical protein NIES4106_50350 [Fischerella sp. NIES-4106]